MWWASLGPEAPHTPQGISLMTVKCRLSAGVSLLFMVLESYNKQGRPSDRCHSLICAYTSCGSPYTQNFAQPPVQLSESPYRRRKNRSCLVGVLRF